MACCACGICRNFPTHLEVQMLLEVKYFSSKGFQSRIYSKNISITRMFLKMYWRRPASCFKHASPLMTGFLSLFLACLLVLSVSHPHLHHRFIFEARYSEIFLLRYYALYLGILETMSYTYFGGGGASRNSRQLFRGSKHRKKGDGLVWSRVIWNHYCLHIKGWYLCYGNIIDMLDYRMLQHWN
jgi:hypothetical protein